MRKNGKYILLFFLGVLAASGAFLLPGCGWLMLLALVPLLSAERIATLEGRKHFWIFHYSFFLVWNLLTTWWVCNATVGGGIFASVANALQMSVVFGLFRWVKKRMNGGVLPYIFLAAAWIAWEKYYLDAAQISWPWLVLGNAFSRTLPLVQWYEFTGTLGGSLWVWAVNLAVFEIMVALSDGSWGRRNGKARGAAVTGLVLVVLAPVALSLGIWWSYRETDDPLDVAILQPTIDPYNKFTAMSQQQQNAILLDQAQKAVRERRDTVTPLLILTPETFTSDIWVNDPMLSPTYRRMVGFTREHPWCNILLGAVSIERFENRPSRTARQWAGYDGWIETHNSALMVDSTGRKDIFHKSKLVVGVESTPYPAVFVPLDEQLGGVMGRDVGQDSVTCLTFRAAGREIPVGCAICYESVYGNYCRDYIRAGAQLLTVITNDAWWGDTPGYRQHLSYASLRAIETRRDIARCANTGISALIDQRGRILEKTPWWQGATLSGRVNLSSRQTFFVRVGDIPGRLSVFVFLLLLCAAGSSGKKHRLRAK